MIDPTGKRSMKRAQKVLRYEDAMRELQAIARGNVEAADFDMWEREVHAAVVLHEIPGDAIEYMRDEPCN